MKKKIINKKMCRGRDGGSQKTNIWVGNCLKERELDRLQIKRGIFKK